MNNKFYIYKLLLVSKIINISLKRFLFKLNRNLFKKSFSPPISLEKSNDIYKILNEVSFFFNSIYTENNKEIKEISEFNCIEISDEISNRMVKTFIKSYHVNDHNILSKAFPKNKIKYNLNEVTIKYNITDDKIKNLVFFLNLLNSMI